jgi:hypothetical protein
LIYIKPSLTGDEPADVLHYAASHPSFPHETTANQFYTESQFESYRALGQHIAESVFQAALDDATDKVRRLPSDLDLGEKHHYRCRELFAAMVRRWFAMPPEYDAQFIQATHGYIDLQEAFRNNPRLWRLTLDLYPELDPNGAQRRRSDETPTAAVERRAAELHVLAQMLQVMENTYLSLDLEIKFAHPRNRGWLDLFHRWSSAETFRMHWPTLRGEFGQDFVRFCEQQMRLGEVTGQPVRLPCEPAPSLTRLLLEFQDQWPTYYPEVKKRLDAALDGGGPMAWAIQASNPYPLAVDPSDGAPWLPAGIILIWPADHAGTSARPIFDLFTWMRGAYRNSGLGRSALRKVLLDLLETNLQANEDKIRLLAYRKWEAAGKPAGGGRCFWLQAEHELRKRRYRLRVRLPLAGLSGPGGELQKRMWLTFFYQLDFEPAAKAPKKEIKLYRDFN